MLSDDAIRLRHMLDAAPAVHAYFDINLDILWRTITDELPTLVDVLKPHMPEHDNTDGPGQQ